jgi:hypothetical protein
MRGGSACIVKVDLGPALDQGDLVASASADREIRIIPAAELEKRVVAGAERNRALDGAAHHHAAIMGRGGHPRGGWGWVRTEEFTVAGADRLPVRFSTIFRLRFDTTGDVSSLVSIGVVGWFSGS